jgi:hypothetical protein
MADHLISRNKLVRFSNISGIRTFTVQQCTILQITCNQPLMYNLFIPTQKHHSGKHGQWTTNTGPSGIQMVIFWTLFKLGFGMVKGSHFVKTIRKPDKKSGFWMVGHLFTIWKPDRSLFNFWLRPFYTKEYSFYDSFLYKTV